MISKKQEIINLGEMLIRTNGYHSFSYADISKPLNIKNAAIHYYFPNKGDLGVAIIDKTIKEIADFNEKTKLQTPTQKLNSFINIYDSSKKQSSVCIVGALSPCFETLPIEMQIELKKLTSEILSWLVLVLDEGKKSGEFTFVDDSQTKAHTIISTLLASLLLQKSLNDKVFDIIKNGIESSLKK